MVTLKQIAEACNVSVASVSKALNNAYDISEKTSERIRNTAHKMGYFPNAAARSLKTNRSNNIGVLFDQGTSSGLTHEYFSRILNNFKIAVEQFGYDITFISNKLGGSPMSYLKHCQYRGCDGVMIACIDCADPSVLELVNSGIPVVTIDYSFDNCGAIISDNVQSMRNLVKYIYSKGHRKIAFIHGDDTPVTRNRLASFYKTCEELGLDIPDEYVVNGVYHDPKSSALATKQLLSLQTPPTCIMYPDDFSYIGCMNEIERQGLRVPDDISVTGYDGIYLGRVIRPKLTTLRQDCDAIGIEAAKMLINAIESPRTYIPKQVIIPGTVLEGDTVKQLEQE